MAEAKKTCKLEHFPWLTPVVTVKDVPTAMAFYEKAFGFSSEMKMPDENGTIVHGNMRYKEEVVMMLMLQGSWGNDAQSPAESKTPPAVSMYVYCEDVNAVCEQARSAKAEVLCEPEDMFWGDRTCVMMDPEGHQWTFATMIPNFVAPKMATA